jgi:hypothetical protein
VQVELGDVDREGRAGLHSDRNSAGTVGKHKMPGSCAIVLKAARKTSTSNSTE